jgi:hypothetical protein
MVKRDGATRLAARLELERMVGEFRAKARELLPGTTPPQYVDRHKGVYAFLYVKPANRIARLLSADREIIVLFTAFRTQQSRTIQVAIDIIDDSEGRLENTLAVIVHRDSEGNDKLKNWGREQGFL